MNDRRFVDERRVREFADASRRMEAERQYAPAIVDRLLKTTPRGDWQILPGVRELQSYGAVRHLSALFTEQLTKDPAYAHAIAELAVSVAEAIPDDAYPRVIVSQIRGYAWKDLGKSFRYLGRNQESEKVLRHAEEKLGGRVALSHDLAVVRFNLAVTLQELERFDESRTLLAECKSIFRQHGDQRNTILASFAQGALLQNMGHFREAREAYLLIVATTPDLDDEQLAALNNAIGLCSIELEEWDTAADAFTYATTLFSELDQPINALNVEAGRGRMYIRAGQYSLGIAHLRPIRRQFLSSGLHEEAGLVGLEIVEGLIEQQRHSAAESLAGKVVSEFELAGLNKRAVEALTFLTKILQSKTASAKNVRDIRQYIVSLRTNPERDFRLTA
jgi:tetratricopeptide (TPR) repeat protein